MSKTVEDGPNFGACLEYLNFNPNWYELWKEGKSPSLALFYKTRSAWLGAKLTQWMSIFTSKKVWEFLIKIQLTKSIWSKKDKEVKESPLMSIRVKHAVSSMNALFSWYYKASMTVFAVCYRSKKVWGIYPDSLARQNARAWAIKGHTKDDLFSSHPPPWNMLCRRSSLEKSF